MLRAFLGRGHCELDTASMYAGGESERIVGAFLASEPEASSTGRRTLMGGERASERVQSARRMDRLLQLLGAQPAKLSSEEGACICKALWEAPHPSEK